MRSRRATRPTGVGLVENEIKPYASAEGEAGSVAGLKSGCPGWAPWA
jgi:hypothetical protein